MTYATSRFAAMVRNPGVRLLLRFGGAVLVLACHDARSAADDSTRASLPPIFAKGPATTTNWKADAGALLFIAVGNTDDSAAIVLPDVTDSSIAALHGAKPNVGSASLDLFGRSGKLASNAAFAVVAPLDSTEGCFTWPAAKLKTPQSGWAVGFVANRVHPVPLDSIESMSSVDSAALAAAIAQLASTLPTTADPSFRGLPFRVRSAFRFRFDSTAAVFADVMRSVNEEANPRLEHILLIGEKPAQSSQRYSVAYYNRTAGAEESTQVTELLAMVLIGRARLPAGVISVEYGDGGRYGLLERLDNGEWRITWKSAFTGC